MKKPLLLLFIFIVSLSITAQQTYVPDDNFEQFLIDEGYDDVLDDYVLTANINTITELYIFFYDIEDLTGIEDFTALTELDCSFNYLTTLDLSNNLQLTELFCIDNLLTDLNVSSNTQLTRLYCGSNQLTQLDVSNNPLLTTLDVADNNITGLDVSNNQQLTILYCEYNQLSSLDVRNGNNTNMTNFEAHDNLDLVCIFVDDAAYSTANWPDIDPTATFVETQAQCEALGINDNEYTISSFYPNPVLDVFTITTQWETDYKIYAINGKLVRQGKLIQGINQLNLTHLDKGIYFFKAGQKTIKIIKQ